MKLTDEQKRALRDDLLFSTSIRAEGELTWLIDRIQGIAHRAYEAGHDIGYALGSHDAGGGAFCVKDKT